jgi:plasmid stabilization system protein ParE
MVKQIIWSKIAQEDKKSILRFWIIKNQSNRYSKKLNYYFNNSVRLISKFPLIGKKTEFPDIRIKIVKNYLLTYRIKPERIEILTIWDSRQDPKEFQRILNNI